MFSPKKLPRDVRSKHCSYSYRCMATKYTVPVHLQMKDQELNVYITYIFCAHNCPELHPRLQSLALKWSLPLICLQHKELTAPSQNAAKGQGVIPRQCRNLEPLTADEVQLRQTWGSCCLGVWAACQRKTTQTVFTNPSKLGGVFSAVGLGWGLQTLYHFQQQAGS